MSPGFDPSLTTLLQSTYLGGDLDDLASCITVPTAGGEILVAGGTASAQFPGTAGGARPHTPAPSDGFVTRFDPSLTTILQSTYLGGRRHRPGLEHRDRPDERRHLRRRPHDFGPVPRLRRRRQSSGGGTWDGFVAALDATLTTLIRSTYLGGSGRNTIMGLAINPAGTEILVTGSVDAPDFPATAGGAQSSLRGRCRAMPSSPASPPISRRSSRRRRSTSTCFRIPATAISFSSPEKPSR